MVRDKLIMTGSKVRFLPYPPGKNMRYFFSIIGILAGIVLVWKTYAITNLFGHISWAEAKLGSGGTYMLYKIIGIAFIIISILTIFGIFEFSLPIPRGP